MLFGSHREICFTEWIGLHGIWSWISDANREVIVDFLRRKLKVGGAVSAAIFAGPREGWENVAGLGQLCLEHAGGSGLEDHEKRTGVGVGDRESGRADQSIG